MTRRIQLRRVRRTAGVAGRGHHFHSRSRLRYASVVLLERFFAIGLDLKKAETRVLCSYLHLLVKQSWSVSTYSWI